MGSHYVYIAKEVMIKYLTILFLLLSGCSSRSVFDEDNPVKPISNLYNRNFIVATPTAVGNAICGAPFLLVTTLVDSLIPGKKSDTYFNTMNNLVYVPASICGSVTGTLFVPISFVCDENPWDFNYKFVKNVSYTCNMD